MGTPDNLPICKNGMSLCVFAPWHLEQQCDTHTHDNKRLEKSIWCTYSAASHLGGENAHRSSTIHVDMAWIQYLQKESADSVQHRDSAQCKICVWPAGGKSEALVSVISLHTRENIFLCIPEKINFSSYSRKYFSAYLRLKY